MYKKTGIKHKFFFKAFQCSLVQATSLFLFLWKIDFCMTGNTEKTILLQNSTNCKLNV